MQPAHLTSIFSFFLERVWTPSVERQTESENGIQSQSSPESRQHASMPSAHPKHPQPPSLALHTLTPSSATGTDLQNALILRSSHQSCYVVMQSQKSMQISSKVHKSVLFLGIFSSSCIFRLKSALLIMRVLLTARINEQSNMSMCHVHAQKWAT